MERCPKCGEMTAEKCHYTGIVRCFKRSCMAVEGKDYTHQELLQGHTRWSTHHIPKTGKPKKSKIRRLL